MLVKSAATDARYPVLLPTVKVDHEQALSNSSQLLNSRVRARLCTQVSLEHGPNLTHCANEGMNLKEETSTMPLLSPLLDLELLRRQLMMFHS